MPTTLQIRRGTETECNAFTGASGELIYDTTNNEIRVHDGVTQGGHKIHLDSAEILALVGNSVTLSTLSNVDSSAPSAGQVLKWNGAAWAPADDDGLITVQEEGSSLSTAASTLNFVGSGVTATGSGAVKTNTIDDLSGGSISITSSINVSGDATLGSINISGNTIQSNNSNLITINDNVSTNTNKLTVNGTEYGGTSGDINTLSGETTFGSSIRLSPNKLLIFEGATDDAFETAITVTDPTADRVITLPDAGGDIMLTGATGQVSNTNIADNTITSAKFNNAVSLVLYNSSGVALKTLYGAGV